jgi:hypothetical protein
MNQPGALGGTGRQRKDERAASAVRRGPYEGQGDCNAFKAWAAYRSITRACPVNALGFDTREHVFCLQAKNSQIHLGLTNEVPANYSTT